MKLQRSILKGENNFNNNENEITFRWYEKTEWKVMYDGILELKA